MTLLAESVEHTGVSGAWARAHVQRLALTAALVFVFVTTTSAMGFTAGMDSGARLTAWLHRPLLDDVLREVERPGQRVVVLPVLFAATAYLGWRSRRNAPWLAALIAVAGVNVCVGLLKWWSERATPRLGGPEFFNHSIDRTFGAFPSGHATNAGMWVTLAWFLAAGASAHWRRTVRVTAPTIGVVILFCSWLRTTHWVTDLLAGAALGSTLACVGLLVAQRISPWLASGRH